MTEGGENASGGDDAMGGKELIDRERYILRAGRKKKSRQKERERDALTEKGMVVLMRGRGGGVSWGTLPLAQQGGRERQRNEGGEGRFPDMREEMEKIRRQANDLAPEEG